MIKRIVIIIMVVFLLIDIPITLANDENEDTDFMWVEDALQTANSEQDLEIQSKFAVAYDRTSGTIIWGKNENSITPMASTTKIMTAIIILENVNSLEEETEVCKQAANIGGSRLGLKKGDRITLNDLLYGLMLSSGNDCAIQIAVSVSGSVETFVRLMNEKAKEIGLKNTHFVSPHGLDDDSHYTTAFELAKIADYALNIKKFAEIVSTKSYTVKIIGYEKTITNTNELLGYFEGVNGVKTGFTNKAGRCLVTSVNRDDFNIITVVLGANTKKTRTKDSIKIINYIYNNFEMVNLEEKIKEEYSCWKRINEKRIYVDKSVKKSVETYLGDIELKGYPIRKDENEKIKVDICNVNYIKAPVNKDDKIGEVIVSLGNSQIQKVSIMSKEKINKNGVVEYLKIFLQQIGSYNKGWIKNSI